ncbi:flagellar hook-associated protein FlgL [Burkholderia sp. FERM BP-3421]|jgi:flagellar hook-associated protein 3 FlgL|uniref:flagellar hook-associated protein FlgL n=1 Tax=Burkholderia sp. FERM BP-3421 TaxID=1494466 RepID=UPI002361E42D|nr:flagellar hook-associated protein FlgL [Burkholderia sp. FERM BP-3421]WDD95599.1 flagellar hook-associated protein FlgL [Burkholderia sp. FERM BP-3421]
MRISTSQFYSQNVSTMNNQQAQLSQLYQQIASGVSLTTPADNPLNAAQAVQLSMTSATLTQYSANQSSALTSLQMEYQTLTSVNSVLNNIYQTVMSAGKGTLSDSDRSALAAQMQGARDQLLNLANSTDGSGNYVFSGFQANTPPFTNKAGGGVSYSGDGGQRVVQITANSTVAQSDDGASVFQSVPMLGSSPVPAAGASNTGTGAIGAVTITDPTATSNTQQFTITFGGTAAAPTYTVTPSAVTPPTPQPYTSGAAIALGNGEKVAISGTPAAGDTFTVTPAPQSGTDIFGALDTMIAALQQPVGSSTVAATALQNIMTTGATKLTNTMTNVLTVQASVSGRAQEVQAMQTVTTNNSLQTSNSLADLTSTNMPAAISQFLQVQNALTATQKTFVQMQNLSLFQYINP